MCCVRRTQGTHTEITTFRMRSTQITFVKVGTGNRGFLLGQDKKIEDIIIQFWHEVQCNFAQEWTKHIDKFQKKTYIKHADARRKLSKSNLSFPRRGQRCIGRLCNIWTGAATVLVSPLLKIGNKKLLHHRTESCLQLMIFLKELNR